MSLLLLLKTENKVPHGFAIEHRSKAGVLKNRWDNTASDISWEWNARGGCGTAEFTLIGTYTDYSIEADDDIQIYQKDISTGSGKVVYRGFISSWERSLSSSESISVACDGYFSKLDRYVLNDAGDPIVYSGMGVEGIVSDFVDTFIGPNSTPTIIKGTIDASSFAPDSIEFKTTVKDALATLAGLTDPPVEYGIDEKLQLYWRETTQTVRNKFWIGHNVSQYSELNETEGIINKVYFEGNTSSGVVFTATGSSDNSQTNYGLHEAVISNSSINTNSTANQYITATLKYNSRPKSKIRANINRLATRLEDTLPLGAVMIVDSSADQTSFIWGTAGNGGSDLTWGDADAGGSDKTWGTNKYYQIERIRYSLNSEEGYFDIELELGGSRYDTPAIINRIETNLEAVRQRQI